MILVDTSVWIEFFRNPTHEIGLLLTEQIEAGNIVALSSTFGELLQGARNSVEERRIMDFWYGVRKVDEHLLFIEAGKLANRHRMFQRGVGLIDCHLIAAAQSFNLFIWTLDKRLYEAFAKI